MELVSLLESPIMFDKSFRVTSVAFFVANLNFLSWELDNWTFKLCIKSFYIVTILKQNKVTILSCLPVKY